MISISGLKLKVKPKNNCMYSTEYLGPRYLMYVELDIRSYTKKESPGQVERNLMVMDFRHPHRLVQKAKQF